MAGAWLQRLLGRDPEEALLREVRAGGGAFERVEFTRNRRVMASAAEGGRVLRLHECFREAPPEVLRAIGVLLARRAGSDAAGARSLVRDFLRERQAAAPPRRAARRVAPADREEVARLRREFERVNREHFAGELPEVPISLSGRMRRRNGHFSADPLEIVLSRTLCREAEPGEAEKTLRHEMIHLWQHVAGRKPGHGADFRRWAARLGVHPRATRTVAWKATGTGG